MSGGDGDTIQGEFLPQGPHPSVCRAPQNPAQVPRRIWLCKRGINGASPNAACRVLIPRQACSPGPAIALSAPRCPLLREVLLDWFSHPMFLSSAVSSSVSCTLCCLSSPHRAGPHRGSDLCVSLRPGRVTPSSCLQTNPVEQEERCPARAGRGLSGCSFPRASPEPLVNAPGPTTAPGHRRAGPELLGFSVLVPAGWTGAGAAL